MVDDLQILTSPPWGNEDVVLTFKVTKISRDD